MKASIIAANVQLIVCAAAAHSVGAERFSGDVAPAVAAVAAPSLPPSCRAAVWPYVPAECGGQSSARPVRVLRAESGR